MRPQIDASRCGNELSWFIRSYSPITRHSPNWQWLTWRRHYQHDYWKNSSSSSFSTNFLQWLVFACPRFSLLPPYLSFVVSFVFCYQTWHEAFVRQSRTETKVASLLPLGPRRKGKGRTHKVSLQRSGETKNAKSFFETSQECGVGITRPSLYLLSTRSHALGRFAC